MANLDNRPGAYGASVDRSQQFVVIASVQHKFERCGGIRAQRPLLAASFDRSKIEHEVHL